MHTPRQDAGAMGGRQQPVGALDGHLLSLLSLTWLSPHTPCLKNQQPSFEAHPIPTTLTQQAREAPRNPLGEIQSPYLLILRTSHHRIEEKIMKLSIFQLAFPSTVVALTKGWRLCSYFYPQISGIADLSWLQDTTVNSSPSTAITRSLSHNTQLHMATVIIILDTWTPTTEPTSKALGLPKGSDAIRGPLQPTASACWRRTPSSGFLFQSFKGPLSRMFLWFVADPVQNSSLQPQRATLWKAVLLRPCFNGHQLSNGFFPPLLNLSPVNVQADLPFVFHRPCVFPSIDFFQRFEMLVYFEKETLPHNVDR